MYESKNQKIRRLANDLARWREHAATDQETAAAAVADLKKLAATNNRLCELVAEFIVAGQSLTNKADARALADSLAEACAIEGIDLSIELAQARKGSTGVREPLHIDGAPLVPVTPSRQLYLAERARRSLAEQLATLQAANDAMCRDAATAARTLARAEAVEAAS